MKLHNYGTFINENGMNTEYDIHQEEYLKKRRIEDEEDQLQSYVDMFFNDPEYLKLSANDRFEQICKDFVMLPEVKEKFKKATYKNIYTENSHVSILSFSKFFENTK